MQKQNCLICSPSFAEGKVSCFSQKENLGLSTIRSSKKKPSENLIENLLKNAFIFGNTHVHSTTESKLQSAQHLLEKSILPWI